MGGPGWDVVVIMVNLTKKKEITELLLAWSGGDEAALSPLMDEVYDEIEYELRSQYLLTYYPTAPGRSGAWRDVDVDVEPRGLRPRTLSGYWQ